MSENKNIIRKTLFFSLIMLLAIIGVSQPVVVTHPQDSSVCVESSAGFSIIAVNTSAYRWQEYDGVGWYNISATTTYASGENTPDLSIIDANLALNGYQYRCIVSDMSDDRDTSLPAILGVYEPPVITDDPADARVCKNEIAEFLTGSLNGTLYQWQENSGVGWLNLEENSFYTGTQTPDLSIYTVIGMHGFQFRCIIKNVSCPDTTLPATLLVDPTPIVFAVTGGGEYCEGSPGVEIGLDGSETGISYNLMLDGVQTGQVLEGTGAALNFGEQLLEGIYTITAYNQFTSCISIMVENAEVIKNPLPLDMELLGGGVVCEGDELPAVYMLGSEIGIEYSLYHNSVFTGQAIVGTGFGINFGSQNETGFYSVKATNISTGCEVQMTGIVEIQIMELPIANAGLDQTIIQGDNTSLAGTAIGGSETYQWFWNPTNLCTSPETSTTGTVNLFQSTVFTLQATDVINGCVSLEDTVIVYVTGGAFVVSAYADNSIICENETAVLSAVPSGGSGTYEFSWTSSPPGFTSAQQSISVSPLVTTQYICEVSDGVSVATTTLTVTVNPAPSIFNITGGGAYCNGDNGKSISLSGSEIGVEYTLYHNDNAVHTYAGTGYPLIFGKFTEEGSYTATAQNIVSGCVSLQSGTVLISINEIPVADAGPDIVIAAGEFANLDGEASGGTGNYSYQWSPSDSLINSTTQDPVTTPLEATTLFELLVTDGNGCVSDADNAIVFVTGNDLDINLLASNNNICPNEEVQLYAMATGGSGSFSYFWTSNPMGFSSTSMSPIVTPNQSTTYIVSVSDGLLSITDSITINVNPAPTIFNVIGGGEVCQGESPDNIILEGSEVNVDYTLLIDGQSTDLVKHGTGYNIDFGSWSFNGIYSVEAVNAITLCENTMEGQVEIVIVDPPIVNAGDDQLIEEGSSANLTGLVLGGSGDYSYLWQPSYLCVNPDNTNTSTTNLSQTTAFSFSAFDNQSQCNSVADTVVVYINNDDKLAVMASTTSSAICQGGHALLYSLATGGTGNYSYLWTSLPSGFYSSSQNLTVTPNVSTSYIVQAFDGVNYAYDTVMITVNALPQIFNLTGGGGYCFGGSGKTIGLSGSESGIVYNLYREPSEFVAQMNGTGLPINFGAFTSEGRYFCEAVNSTSCEITMAGVVEIEIYQNPIAYSGEDKTIGYNTSTAIEGSVVGGSGSYNYYWLPEDSLLNAYVQSPVTIPLHATTQFNFNIVDQNTGCESNDDETIVFVTGGLFTLNLICSDPSICSGENTQLTALVSGGSGEYTFVWESDPEGFVSDIYNPVVAPTSTTIYTVYVNDGTQTLSSSVKIQVQPLPTTFLVDGGGQVCEGMSIDDITLSGSENDVIYTLLLDGAPAGMEVPGTGFPINFGTWNQSGIYSVEAVHSTSMCYSSMAGSADVEYFELPVANAGYDVIIEQNTTTVLSGSASGGSGNYSWNWLPEILCQSANMAATQTMPINETTLFKLNVIDNQTQCQSDNDTVIVFVSGDNLDVDIVASTQNICESAMADLLALPSGGTGNYSFSWSSVPTGFSSNLINPTVSPIVTTIYTVEVFDGVETVNSSIIISVTPLPMPYNITGGGSYCKGSAGVEIGLDGSDVGVLYTLFLYPDTEIINVIGTGNVLSFGNQTVAGEYFAVANASSPCYLHMNGSATISVNQLPISNAGIDKTVDIGGQVILNGSAEGGSGNYMFGWQPQVRLLNPDVSEPLTVPMQETTLFNLNVTDEQTGCLGSQDDCVVFVTGGPLSLVVTSSAGNICAEEDVQLFALISGGSGEYSYLWTENPGNNTYDIYNPVVEPVTTTVYTVTVSDGTNMLTDSIIINVDILPTPFNLLGGGTYCSNGNGIEVFLENSEITAEYELYSQYGSTGIVVPGTGAALSFDNQYNEGYYWAVATNTGSLCSNIMNDTVQVEIAEIPVSDAGADQYIPVNTSTQLFGNANGGSGYYGFNWFPDYLLENSELQNPITSDLGQTELFRMLVNDVSNGCVGIEDTIIVYVTDVELSVQATANPEYSCAGSQVNLSVLPSGGTGNYSFDWTSEPSGFYSSEQFPLVYPIVNTKYIVSVSDGDTTIVESVSVVVTDVPKRFSILGGGSFCANDVGVNISLSGSETDVDYTLIRDSYHNMLTIAGTGTAIDFGNINISGSYFVIAVNALSGCTEQMLGSVIVEKFPLPIANAGIDVIADEASNITLNGSASGNFGDVDYLWQPVNKLLNPTDPDATTVALYETSMFSLEVTDNQTSCVSEKDNMIVFITGGDLTVDVIFDKNIVCPEETVKVYALPSGGSGNYSYYWHSVPEGLIATAQYIEVSPSVLTKYIVTVHDGDDKVMDSATIDIYPIPQMYALLGGGGYCEGGNGKEIVLDNSEESVFYSLYRNTIETGNYMVGNGLPISFGTYLTEGHYSVIATNNNGCNSLMNNVVSVFTYPLPEKFTVYGGGTYCENDPSLGILLESSQSGVNYELLKDAEPTGIIIPGNDLPISFGDFDGTGYYSVEAYGDDNGCASTMNGVAALVLNPVPEINVSGSNNMCAGDSVVLSVTGALNYEWNTLPPSYAPSIKVSPEVTTVYSVVGYNNYQCMNVADHEVVVNETPAITLFNDVTSETLICDPANLDNYIFRMNGNIVQEGNIGSWYYGSSGVLSDTIYVMATNAYGCSDTKSEFVELGNNPNAFSPNNDGVNDLFMKGYDIKVFSNWGGELYSGSDGWDGRYNGELVAPGTYYYVHHVYNVDGSVLKTIKGSVTVVIE